MYSQALIRRVVYPAVCLLLSLSSTALAPAQNVIATIPAQNGATGTPMTIAVNPFTQLVYIAGNGVEVVDQRTNQPVTTFPVGQNELTAVAINPVTRKLYVTDYATGTYIVDLTTDRIVGQFPLADARFMTYNPATNLVYTLDNYDNIWVTDGTTGALIKEIVTPAQSGTATGYSMTMNPATNLLYIPLETSPASMYVVNAVTDAVTTVALQGIYANFAGVDPLRNIIYVDEDPANGQSGGEVEVLNGATNTDVALISPIPALPETISVDPLTRRLYVPDANGNVYVIDGNTNTLTSTVIPVGINPIFSSLDLAHGLLYVGNTALFQPGTPGVSVIRLR